MEQKIVKNNKRSTDHPMYGYGFEANQLLSLQEVYQSPYIGEVFCSKFWVEFETRLGQFRTILTLNVANYSYEHFDESRESAL